jgi:hypothetical protein
MFSRETSKNLTEAKLLEQRLVASAFLKVRQAHRVHGAAPLSDVIQQIPAHPDAQHIGEAIHALRLALSVKQSPFLRDLSLAIFVGAPLFKPLTEAVAWLPTPRNCLDLFGKTREEAASYVASSGHTLHYYLHHPRFIWSAFMSTYIGGLLFGKMFPFDPKAFAWNTSGRLFAEEFEDCHHDPLCLDWTVGPTPTVGDRIAPEADAAIQSLHSKSSLCFQHKMWIYVNLQNLQGMSERGRSRALIDASQKNPSKFRLASVSVDSPLYLGRISTLSSLRDHKRHLLQDLHKGLSCSASSWYAFSLIDGEKEEWWHCIEEVVEKAFFIAEETSHPIPVFHELVVLGLIRAWQGFCCRNVQGSVMSTIACKECADRGGSVNAAFSWAMTDVAEIERASIVQAVLWGRPLLARQRLIEKRRTRGFEMLVRSLMPSDVRTYLDYLWGIGCHDRWQKKAPLSFETTV